MNRSDRHNAFHRHYRLPGDYFQKLESRMQQRLAPAPRRILWRRRMLQAAAAVLVGLVAWPLYRNLHTSAYHGMSVANDSVNLHVIKQRVKPSSEDGQIDLSDIPDEVIEEYLLVDDDEPLTL